MSTFNKKLGITVLLLYFSVIPLSAAMVSFLVIEEGLRPGTETENYSSVWEGGLMSAFFDAGHIVSNSPVLRVESISATDFPKEAGTDFLDAANGGADYFILAILNFNTQERKVKPVSVSIRIYTTGIKSGAGSPGGPGLEKSRQLIYERIFPAGTGINLQDEYSRAQEIARIVAARLSV